MLTDIIPARYRKPIYAAYALGVVALGVWQILGIAPEILQTISDVWLYLGVAVGAVAASNTPTTHTPQHAAE